MNSRSGHGQGAELARVLARHGDCALCDVATTALDQWLPAHRHLQGIVAAGGDGTVHWLINALAACGLRLPLAPWPMGTGNDCARFLGWSARRADPQGVAALLAALARAPQRLVDCWALHFPSGQQRLFVNYCSLGLDARIAHAFHQQRNRHPGLYRGGLMNKALYGFHALADASRPLGHRLRLGEVFPPANCHGLLWCNIPSYAGGMLPHPRIRADDRVLDGFQIAGRSGLALALSPLRRPRPQAPSDPATGLRWQLLQPLVMQIDGEALCAPCGPYHISHWGQVTVLAAPPEDPALPIPGLAGARPLSSAAAP